MDWVNKSGTVAATCTQCSYSKNKCIRPHTSTAADTTAATPPPTPAAPKAKTARGKSKAKKVRKTKPMPEGKSFILSHQSTNADCTATTEMVVDKATAD